MAEPSETYVVGGAGLPVTTTCHPFDREYDPRWFQDDALEWIHGSDTAPVELLAAPTGAGKTDVIAALADAASQTLCVYPTNALIDAQNEELESRGLETEIVTGETLSGQGQERANELLQRVKDGQLGDRDVFITNPDVLQATVQNLYFSPGSRLLQLYAQFDAAVFDEFHYYGPLAASGLLTQIKILSERGAELTAEGKEPPRFLLSSATPDARFVEYVRDDLGLDVRETRSRLRGTDVSPRGPTPETELVYQDDTDRAGTPDVTEQFDEGTGPVDSFPGEVTVETPPDTSRFRSPMLVRRYDASIGKSFETVADTVQTAIEREYEGGEPIAAVIFNSAARSNEFQEFLRHNRPALEADVAKDNGYDTNADRTVPAETAALNTTSKGEVGLDFDIRHLAVAKPFTATQFIQRIGRAGRQSPAVVDIYGLADPGWPPAQAYPGFLRRVADTLGESETRYRQLRDLAGMRSAHALRDRLSDDRFHNEGIYEDFSGFPTESRWRGFLDDLEAARETLEGDDWLGPTLDRSTARLIRGAHHATAGLQSLRGQTLTHPVTYPRAGEQEQTEYDLTSALAHYAIDRVDSERVVHLSSERSPGPLRGYYPGQPNGGDGIDLMQAGFIVERKLREGYLELVERADTLSDVPLSEADLRAFFELIPLRAATIPDRLRAGLYEIECDTDRGGVSEIARRE